MWPGAVGRLGLWQEKVQLSGLPVITVPENNQALRRLYEKGFIISGNINMRIRTVFATSFTCRWWFT